MSDINKWIDHVNTRVIVENNREVRMRRSRDEPGFRSSKGLIIPRHPLSVDIITYGPCSRELREEMPTPNLEWLEGALQMHPTATKVAVYPRCCGGDYSEFQELIRRRFPDIAFVFLNVPDMSGTPHHFLHEVVRAAVKAEIIGIMMLE